MVQEEKLKEANRLYKDANEDQRYVLELLFPELKQSEDEKIRQELLQIAKESEDTFYMPMTPYKRKRIIAWFEKHGDYSRLVEEMKKRKELLSKEKENATSDNDKLSLGGRIAILEELLVFSNEKQGEQKKSYDICDSSMMDSKKSPYGEKRDFGYFEEKPTDKIEPNFNFEVGQWIVARGKCVYLITKIDGFDITLVDTNGDESVFDASSLNDAHLWDIRDAKDGDVIVCPKYAGNTIPNIFIFKGIAVNDNDVYCHCSFSKAFISTECYIASVDSINTDFYPATIEQRAILSKEMTNAGYTFDFENKELKKIKNIVCSEEDEYWRQKAIDLIKHPDLIKATPTIAKHTIDWLKSLKEGYTWKPSDEQMEALDWALSLAKNCGEECAFGLRTLQDQLKKLKE